MKIVFAAGLLYWLYKNDQLDFSLLVKNTSYTLQGLGLIVFMLSLIPQTLRWQAILKAQGIKFSIWRVLQWTWIGQFFALILPGGAGTEISRGYYAYKNTPHARTAAISTVIIDRFFGLVSLLFLGAIAALALYGEGNDLSRNVFFLGLTTIIISTGAILGFVSLAYRPVRNFVFIFIPHRLISPIDAVISGYVDQKRKLLWAFALSIVTHFLLLGAFVLAASAIHIVLPWKEAFLVVPYVTIANVLPISPAGIGIGEMTASVLFSQFDIANGAIIMLLVRMWMAAMQLSGGMVYILYRDNRPH